jgi:hypothetical protein
MQTILSIALAIIALYILFEIVVGIRVIIYILRRRTDPIRSRLSRVLGEDAS